MLAGLLNGALKLRPYDDESGADWNAVVEKSARS